ncbi:TlpA family protein disulfide reductase [Pseudomonas sp. UBA6310]|uniref:TlpA family protein disulfide reductase n=1 Tax=Pseudomonas sp. UBA6310 TaxID=1947327 RepID=UPI00257A3F96|nr:TlpA disulfide reductase family protein [Pseudomonas sp. UBA6310]
MGTQLRRVMGLLACLLLSGCGENLGLDQHGQKVTAGSLEGQWLVINYWAEWCGPCRTEIPQLNQLSEQLASEGGKVIGVNFDGLQDEALSKAASDMGIRFVVLARDPAERFALPRSEALPATFIVDPQGKLRERLLGEQTAEGLRARLATLRSGS